MQSSGVLETDLSFQQLINLQYYQPDQAETYINGLSEEKLKVFVSSQPLSGCKSALHFLTSNHKCDQALLRILQRLKEIENKKISDRKDEKQSSALTKPLDEVVLLQDPAGNTVLHQICLRLKDPVLLTSVLDLVSDSVFEKLSLLKNTDGISVFCAVSSDTRFEASFARLQQQLSEHRYNQAAGKPSLTADLTRNVIKMSQNVWDEHLKKIDDKVLTQSSLLKYPANEPKLMSLVFQKQKHTLVNFQNRISVRALNEMLTGDIFEYLIQELSEPKEFLKFTNRMSPFFLKKDQLCNINVKNVVISGLSEMVTQFKRQVSWLEDRRQKEVILLGAIDELTDIFRPFGKAIMLAVFKNSPFEYDFLGQKYELLRFHLFRLFFVRQMSNIATEGNDFILKNAKYIVDFAVIHLEKSQIVDRDHWICLLSEILNNALDAGLKDKVRVLLARCYFAINPIKREQNLYGEGAKLLTGIQNPKNLNIDDNLFVAEMLSPESLQEAKKDRYAIHSQAVKHALAAWHSFQSSRPQALPSPLTQPATMDLKHGLPVTPICIEGGPPADYSAMPLVPDEKQIVSLASFAPNEEMVDFDLKKQREDYALRFQILHERFNMYAETNGKNKSEAKELSLIAFMNNSLSEFGKNCLLLVKENDNKSARLQQLSWGLVKHHALQLQAKIAEEKNSNNDKVEWVQKIIKLIFIVEEKIDHPELAAQVISMIIHDLSVGAKLQESIYPITEYEQLVRHFFLAVRSLGIKSQEFDRLYLAYDSKAKVKELIDDILKIFKSFNHSAEFKDYIEHSNPISPDARARKILALALKDKVEICCQEIDNPNVSLEKKINAVDSLRRQFQAIKMPDGKPVKSDSHLAKMLENATLVKISAQKLFQQHLQLENVAKKAKLAGFKPKRSVNKLQSELEILNGDPQLTRSYVASLSVEEMNMLMLPNPDPKSEHRSVLHFFARDTRFHFVLLCLLQKIKETELVKLSNTKDAKRDEKTVGVCLNPLDKCVMLQDQNGSTLLSHVLENFLRDGAGVLDFPDGMSRTSLLVLEGIRELMSESVCREISKHKSGNLQPFVAAFLSSSGQDNRLSDIREFGDYLGKIPDLFLNQAMLLSNAKNLFKGLHFLPVEEYNLLLKHLSPFNVASINSLYANLSSFIRYRWEFFKSDLSRFIPSLNAENFVKPLCDDRNENGKELILDCKRLADGKFSGAQIEILKHHLRRPKVFLPRRWVAALEKIITGDIDRDIKIQDQLRGFLARAYLQTASVCTDQLSAFAFVEKAFVEIRKIRGEHLDEDDKVFLTGVLNTGMPKKPDENASRSPADDKSQSPSSASAALGQYGVFSAAPSKPESAPSLHQAAAPPLPLEPKSEMGSSQASKP